MHEEYFAASDLVKKSAAQIKFLRDKLERIITSRMQRGVEYQHKVAEEKGACEEMRTTLVVDGLVIFASHDLVTDNYLAEVKNIEEGYEEWYLESSLLQTAFFKSLLMCSNGYITTPKFRVKEGYTKQSKKINVNLPYYLIFGTKLTYEVEVKEPEKIIEYFIDKARHTYDYDSARAYDQEHKFKHYKECKKYFNYKKTEALQ